MNLPPTLTHAGMKNTKKKFKIRKRRRKEWTGTDVVMDVFINLDVVSIHKRINGESCARGGLKKGKLSDFKVNLR